MRSWRNALIGAAAVGATLLVSQLPPHARAGIDFWLGLAGAMLLAIFAGIIGWKRPESNAARLLSLVLIATVFATALDPWNFWRGPMTLQLAAWTLAAMIAPIAPLLFARYADAFGEPSATRRRLLKAQYVLAIPSVIVGLAPAIATTSHAIAPAFALLAAYTNPALDLQFLFALACAILAIRASHGDDRQRILWATIASAPYILANVFVGWPGVPDEIGNAALLIWPIGLTYAALRGKLLDVAFAVNRAAVFTIVSAIVLVLFVAFEWVLAEWAKPVGHEADLFLSLGFALVLGISMRFIHHRVDLLIDKLLFRKRNADLAALRNFASEAPFIANRQVLIARTIAVVCANTGASTATVVLADDPGVGGEVTLPLLAGATTLGTLVCGAKADGEGYPPDEIDALTAIARGVAEALLLLELQELRALRARPQVAT